jgi:hypothetical protein
LFFWRRIVQDGEAVHWSEPTPSVPDEDELAELTAPSAVVPA